MFPKFGIKEAVKQYSRQARVRKKLLSWKVILPITTITVLMMAIFMPTGTEDSSFVVMAAGAGTGAPSIQSAAARSYLKKVTTSKQAGKEGKVLPVSGEFTEQEIQWLATLIYHEVSYSDYYEFQPGYSWPGTAQEAMRQLTAMVAINRARSQYSTFAKTDTLEEVLKAPGQYGYFSTYEEAVRKKAAGADMTGSYIFYPQFGKDYNSIKASNPEGLAICEASARLAATGQVVDASGNPVPGNVLYEHSFKKYNAVKPGIKAYMGFKYKNSVFWICSDPDAVA